MVRSCFIVILVKSQKSLDLVCSIYHSAKNLSEMFVIQHTSNLTKYNCNLHYLAMLIMASQILKSTDFTKTQKIPYLERETFFLQIKNSLITNQGLHHGKNSFVTEVTFK